jgi:type I restriction enzyme, S subunit
MNSQLPDGYKQTEIGMIPNDWNVLSISQFASVSSGGTPSRQVAAYWGGEIPWITTSQIDFNLIDSSNEFITQEGLKNSAAKVYNAGTLLMAMYGQGKTRGKVAITGITATINQACAAISLSSSVSKSFVFHNLASRYQEIRELSNTGNQENLNGHLIKNIFVAIPPSIEEQEAIAHALSDIDALIESLDRLLTKKRQIKQGAMQELLRSKDGWEKKYIGDVLTISHGRSQHEVVDENGDYPILASGGEIGRAKKYLYNKPSVLIGRKGTIDKPQYMDQPFWTVDTLFYSVIHEPNDAKYIFYQFCLIPWREYNEASGVPSLNARTIHSIEITLPPPEEQIEIATILSDMNAEIDSIEAKLTKTRQIKQGMMHELLTGRIRLV